MVAYSLKPRFIPAILSGAKRQTIRAIGRRRHATPGDALQLYTGMRTKQCRLIGTAVCLGNEAISLRFRGEPSVAIEYGQTQAWFSGPLLDDFARRDGFPDWAAMLAFWRETHPEATDSFSGVIIEWGGFTAAGVGL